MQSGEEPLNIDTMIDDLKSQLAQYKCEECLRSFRKKSKLQRHINESHLNLKPFKCHSCQKQFKRSHHLERHELSHTNTRPFKCEDCISAFNSRDHLSRHIKIMHLREFLKCEQCSQEFLKKRSFRKHQKQHLMKKQKVERAGKKIVKEKMMYICTFQGCQTPFSQHFALRRHYNKAHRHQNIVVVEKSNPTTEENKDPFSFQEPGEEIFIG